MKKVIVIGNVFLVLIMLVNACKHEPKLEDTSNNGGNNNGTNNPCDSNIVYFEKDILPIFTANCAMSGCHDPASAEDEVILNNYQNIMATGEIKPNNPNESKAYEVLITTKPDKVMPRPPMQRLSQAQIDLIAKWINQGAKNVNCNAGACDTTGVTYTKQVSPVINTYCVSCHNNISASGGINLEGYTNAKNATISGNVVGTILNGTMPKGGTPLSACNKRKIQLWAAAGCPQ